MVLNLREKIIKACAGVKEALDHADKGARSVEFNNCQHGFTPVP